MNPDTEKLKKEVCGNCESWVDSDNAIESVLPYPLYFCNQNCFEEYSQSN